MKAMGLTHTELSSIAAVLRALEDVTGVFCTDAAISSTETGQHIGNLTYDENGDFVFVAKVGG